MPAPRKKQTSLSKSPPPPKRFKPGILTELSDSENFESSPEIVERPEEFMDSDDANDEDDDDEQHEEKAGPSSPVVLRSERVMGPSSPIPPHSSGYGKEDLREAFQKCVNDLRPYNSTKDELDAWIQHLPEKFTKLVIFAFGKYSREMATAATEAVQNFIAIPKTVILVPPTAQHLLPVDQNPRKGVTIFAGTRGVLTGNVSCTLGSKEILETIVDMDSEATMFLFMGSPEGEDLFCWPQTELDESEKKTTLDLIRKAGATSEQMRICRARLSAIKGDKMTKFIQQGSAHTLLISNGYPGPVRYEQCGVMETRPAHIVHYSVADILKRLRVDEAKIDAAALAALKAPSEKDLFHYHDERFTTCMVACNYTALHLMSENLTHMGYDAHIVNKPLTGCAMANGRLFAKLITQKICQENYLISGEKFEYRFPMALIFGGKLKTSKEDCRHHGGPNLNLVRHCMDFLSVDGENPHYEFTFMSATTTGMDHGAEVGGALISNADIVTKARRKTPYVFNASTFWSGFNNGANLLQLESTEREMDLLDVQVLLLHRDLRPDMVPMPHMVPRRVKSPVVLVNPSRAFTGSTKGPSKLSNPVALNHGAIPAPMIHHGVPSAAPMNHWTHYPAGCGNCQKTDDVKFRKVDDLMLCNACCLYYKKNGRHRPQSLIQARIRAEFMPKTVKIRNPRASKW